jgi:hypothetical protein
LIRRRTKSCQPRFQTASFTRVVALAKGIEPLASRSRHFGCGRNSVGVSDRRAHEITIRSPAPIVSLQPRIQRSVAQLVISAPDRCNESRASENARPQFRNAGDEPNAVATRRPDPAPGLAQAPPVQAGRVERPAGVGRPGGGLFPWWSISAFAKIDPWFSLKA